MQDNIKFRYEAVTRGGAAKGVTFFFFFSEACIHSHNEIKFCIIQPSCWCEVDMVRGESSGAAIFLA